jgi:competence protein ComEC
MQRDRSSVTAAALMGPLGACLFVAAVTIGAATHVQAGAGFAVAVAALTMWSAGPRRLRMVFGLLLVVGCGVGHGAAARAAALSPPLLTWFDDVSGGASRALDVIHVEGTLAADAVAADGAVRLMIDVVRVRHQGGWREAAGRVQAHVAGQLAAAELTRWTAGRPIRAPARLRRPPVWRNFGGPTEAWQQLHRPFVLAATIKSAALVDVVPGAPWDEAAAAGRREVRGAIERFVSPRDATAAAIAKAILIGDRTSLDPAIVDRLQVAGTYHVIAISGGNVALLTALCFLGVRALVRSPRLGAAFTIGAVLVYGWIVGGDPSVARAVAAASVFLAASAIGLRPRPLHVLATIAGMLAAVDPLMTVDVGAWLSFGATLGIIVGATRLSSLIDRPVVASRQSGRVWRSARRGLLRSLAATAAADLVLLPIAAAAFHRVTVAGLLLNVVAIPAMAVLQCAGLAVVFLQPVPPVATAAAAVVAAASQALVESARVVDWLPWLSWRVPPLSIWWTAIYFAATAVAVWRPAPRIGTAATAVAAAALLAIVTAPDVVRGVRAPEWLRIVALDVGQGDALLIRLPSGQTMLVDAGGSAGAFDVGARIVTPAIWAQQVSRLEWLVITHPDQDHIGGAPSVVTDVPPREVWEGIAVPRIPALIVLRELARTRGLPWREVRAGDRLEAGGVAIEVLHPPAPDWERQRVRNDDSVVLRLRYRDVELLLTGDAGVEFESDASFSADSAPVRVLKAAHHGSRSSSSDRFVRGYAPDIVLISAGAGNLFGHPAAEVLDRFQAVGAETFRTDGDGAVMLETDGRTVVARTYRGRTWRLDVVRMP